MLQVVACQRQVVSQRGSSDEDIGIADQLAGAVKVS
jgi:hypothetical protein